MCLGRICSMRWRKVPRHSVRRIVSLRRSAPRELTWNFHHMHHHPGCHHTYHQHRCPRWSYGIRVKRKLIWLDFFLLAAILDSWIPHNCQQCICTPVTTFLSIIRVCCQKTIIAQDLRGRPSRASPNLTHRATTVAPGQCLNPPTSGVGLCQGFL